MRYVFEFLERAPSFETPIRNCPRIESKIGAKRVEIRSRDALSILPLTKESQFHQSRAYPKRARPGVRGSGLGTDRARRRTERPYMYVCARTQRARTCLSEL